MLDIVEPALSIADRIDEIDLFVRGTCLEGDYQMIDEVMYLGLTESLDHMIVAAEDKNYSPTEQVCILHTEPDVSRLIVRDDNDHTTVMSSIIHVGYNQTLASIHAEIKEDPNYGEKMKDIFYSSGKGLSNNNPDLWRKDGRTLFTTFVSCFRSDTSLYSIVSVRNERGEVGVGILGLHLMNGTTDIDGMTCVVVSTVNRNPRTMCSGTLVEDLGTITDIETEFVSNLEYAADEDPVSEGNVGRLILRIPGYIMRGIQDASTEVTGTVH